MQTSQILRDCLKYMVEHDGSDLYFTSDAPPSIKVYGKIQPVNDRPFGPGEIAQIAHAIMNEQQRDTFNLTPEMNLALSDPDIGRFRVNIFQQRSEVGMVIRHIKSEIPDIDDLGIPKIVRELALEKNGLVLFVGGTNTGKSTSLAALINHRNNTSAGHIITVEDPIEYIHPHKKSLVNQREVGIDTECYADALKNTLRQSPDVILIGEINDMDTMRYAIQFSETGHLCFSTLHATNAHQALERIVNFFPQARREQLYFDLSLNLRAIISQRLVPSTDGKRVAAFEILTVSPFVKDLLQRGEIGEIAEAMQQSEEMGMQTFDQDLYKLYRNEKITLDDALNYATSRNNLRLKINLEEKNFQPTSSPKPPGFQAKAKPFSSPPFSNG